MGEVSAPGAFIYLGTSNHSTPERSNRMPQAADKGDRCPGYLSTTENRTSAPLNLTL